MKHDREWTSTTKATCLASELRTAVRTASGAVQRRNTVPILGAVLVRVSADEIAITGTDLDTEVRAIIPAENDGPDFAFTISPRLLGDLLCYADGAVTMQRDGDLIRIEADGVTAEVRELCPVTDWPAFRFERAGAVEIGEAILHKALSAVTMCISNEETRYYLNGVYMHDAGEGLITVATDGHRLSKYETGEAWGIPALILPLEAAKLLLARLRPSGDGTVSVQYTDGDAPRLWFAGDGWRIRCKTIDGKFPDYTRVIPGPSDSIEVTLTADALRRMPISRSAYAIKIEPGNGRMSVCDVMAEAMVTMPVHGRGISFGMNGRYLRDFANYSGTIRVSGASSGDPFRILSDDPRLLQVLMPMRM